MKVRDALDAFELVIRQKLSDEFAGSANNGMDEKIDRVVIQSREAMIITLAECFGNNETAGFL